MKTPKGFNLRKAKIRPDGRLFVKWTSNETNVDGEEPKHCVHDDLREAFDTLKYSLIASHGLNWPDTAFHADLFTSPAQSGAFKSLKPHLEECKAKIANDVEVTGFSSFGDEGTSGCVVTGKLTVNERVMAINTPKILFSGDTFGFEETLDRDIDNAINEVRLYLFEGKAGEAPARDPNQGELEFEEGIGEEEEKKADVSKTVTLKPRKNARK